MAEHNTDPFHWWCDHKRQFPILSELARRFLIIPATSVPSEWLFSDAGNNMTNKRTTISPKIFKECIFLKRNNCIINSFKWIFILIKIITIILIHINVFYFLPEIIVKK